MKYLIFILVIMISPIVCGQNEYLDRFTLRQSFQSKSDMAEPAILTFTGPKGKPNSWLLNAAIGYNLLKSTSSVLSINPYFEYHRNTLIEREQDNWQSGVSVEWTPCDLSVKSWSPILISSIKYNDDRIKQNTSLQGNIYFTPLFKGKAGQAKYFWVPGIASNFGSVFKFVYNPYVGIENEYRVQTDRDSSLGNIFRGYFRITSSISFFPRSILLRDRFNFSFDYQYRYNLNETVDDLAVFDHQYFTMGFNYTFLRSLDEKRSAKIGIDFVNGDNPAKNFEKQSYFALNLKIKL